MTQMSGGRGAVDATCKGEMRNTFLVITVKNGIHLLKL